MFRDLKIRNGSMIVLRPPTQSDLDSLLEFANGLASELEENPNLGIGHLERQTREEEASWLSNLLSDFREGRQVVVTAFLGEKVVGTSRVSRGRRPDVLHYGELHISVAREFRDQGLGYEMIRVLLSESRKIGIQIVSLEVFENNPRAIHLYEKLGFKQTGRYPKKVIRDGKFIDTIIMSTELA